MIYTLTLNPSLDYIMNVANLELGATNRSIGEYIHVGGKGVNVSILLNNLDVESTALGFVGGFTGKQVKDELKKYRYITDEFITYDGNTRINVKIKGERETEINGIGVGIPIQRLESLETILEQLSKTDFVVLSGSMAFNMPADWYVRIAKKLSEKEIPFAVDIASQQLFDILEYRPLIIKPNQHELELLMNKTDLSEAEIVVYAQELLAKGAKHVIVSRGSEGAIMVADGKVYKSSVPSGKLVDSVGAGDSMVAGFIYGYYVQKLSSKEAFQYACSCGSATAYALHLAEKTNIENFYKQIVVKEI